MPPKKKLIVRNPGKPVAYKTNPKSGMVEKAKPKRKLIIRKPKPNKKLLSKKDFIEALDDDQMKKGLFGLPTNYHDVYVSYRNDYPRIARTEKQMDKLSSYSERQVNKQLYDHYKKKGNLKDFNLSNVYGKAF